MYDTITGSRKNRLSKYPMRNKVGRTDGFQFAVYTSFPTMTITSLYLISAHFPPDGEHIYVLWVFCKPIKESSYSLFFEVSNDENWLEDSAQWFSDWIYNKISLGVLKHTATLASHPIDSDLIGLGLHQGIDIFVKLLILMCFQRLRIIGLEGLRDEGLIQEKKTEGRDAHQFRGQWEKAKMRITCAMGRE